MDPQIQTPPPDTTVVTPIDSSTDPMPPQVPASTSTTTPPPVTPLPSKKMNPLIIVIIILLIIFLGVGGFLAYKMLGGKQTVATPVPQQTILDTNPTLTPGTPTPAPTGNGTISGTVCYPASGIPAGKIAVKDTVTNVTTSFDNATDSAAFSVAVPAGQYKLRYEPSTAVPLFGYYTSCTGSEPSCQDTSTKRSSIVVQVTPSQDSPNVKLCDYYYGQGLEPDF
jgi:hypothetical protein